MSDDSDLPAQNGREVSLSADQRAAFLQTVRDNADTHIGNVAALRAIGVAGTRGELHALLKREGDALRDEILEARGWNIEKARKVLYDVACNPDHPAWQRANALFLKAYGGPEFRDDLRRHELTGKDGGPVHLLAGQADLEQLTADELRDLRDLVAKARPQLAES